MVQPSLPRVRVAELAVRHRVPSISPSGGFATAGGLADYSRSQKEMARRTAAIVDKILKGSKPADVPVEQPATFELIINLKPRKPSDSLFRRRCCRAPTRCRMTKRRSARLPHSFRTIQDCLKDGECFRGMIG